mmetsp:Transcript_118391/g.287287  ORF Transcript_118391/g.287287 Transcript_118391/m.287287 type:complete len:276 (-) Transcript_118391:830-1657(-)
MNSGLVAGPLRHASAAAGGASLATRRASRPPLANGLVPALEPRGLGLEVVVRCSPAVHAVGASAPLVGEDAEVIVLLNSQMHHAVVHEEVLAPGLPVQLVAALAVAPIKVGLQGLRGEGLEGSEDHREVRVAWDLVAIHKVVVRASGLRKVLADAPGQHHGIRVRLHRPVVLLPVAVLLDRVPEVHEEERVAGSAVLGLAHEGLLEPLRVDGRAVRRLAEVGPRILAEDRVLVAVEYASAPPDLLLDQAELVGRGHHDLKAEERREAPRRRRGRG